MTLDDIKFIVTTAIGIGQLVLLGCVLLELRDQRITWMLRTNKRRQWVREEHQ